MNVHIYIRYSKDIRKEHKKHINVMRLHSLVSQKLAILNSEDESGVETGEIF